MARCSYCYQEGHNKRTCPVLTANMKKRADSAIAAGNPDAWAVQAYKERTAPKGKKRSRQVCGYCQERGHTRRTCEVLQNDMKWFVERHNALTRVAHDYIVSSPVGIGSLFNRSVRSYNYNAGDYERRVSTFILVDFSMTKKINRDHLDIRGQLRCLSTGERYEINLRDYVVNPDAGSQWASSHRLVTPDAQVVPSDWVSRNQITIADAKKHEYFRRTGRKEQDRREWEFGRRDRAAETVRRYESGRGPQSDHYDYEAEARRVLASYTPEHIRSTIFKDYAEKAG